MADPVGLFDASDGWDFDVIVVGAGPAGSAAALVAARAGKRVCLLERGPFPGAKNMYGGVVYARILDRLIPRWWEEAPIQRWIVRRATMITTPTQSVTIDVRTDAWGEPPYNGATALRPDFDAWLADKAAGAGAVLVTSTTATGLIRDEDRVVGVRTDRPEGDLRAPVVIACDGVNSFLAKEAGLFGRRAGSSKLRLPFRAEPETDPSAAAHYTLGVKEVLRLGRDEIDRRFGVRGTDGVDIEVIGCTGDVPGGGFVYTNLDTIAVGLVLSITALGRTTQRPEELIAEFKAHPAVTPLVEGGELVEYSAHLIPEGGYDAMPELIADGLLVAGDAAGLCLAAGIWLEGVNFAIASGAAAGETAVDALARGDVTAAGLASYRTRLDGSFVLEDHRKLRRVPDLLLSERMQRRYPELICRIAEELFTVRNPEPKPGLRRIVSHEVKRAGLRARDLSKDAWTAMRSYG